MQNLMPPIDTPDNLFHDGNPTQGIEGTIVTAKFLNNQQAATRDLQQEIINVLAAAGVDPDPKKNNQLAEAISAVIGHNVPFASLTQRGIVQLNSATNSVSEDMAATLKAVKLVMDNANNRLDKNQNGADIQNKPLFAHNIGVLTETESDSRYLKASDNILPVGVPQPWPLATPPAGWIICNGQQFDKARCPQLAKVYPNGVLPDLRGVFIRGWDNGRNLDGGRTLLSFQGDAIRNITGYYVQRLAGNSYWDGCGGAFYQEGNAFGHHVINDGGNGATTKRFDASRVVPTANENRPVNMAFNYIVRAA
ncbi:phage tail protein [Yersinia enterocolitica]|uniref:phage tail protein n=1 Tax=Yersinia enterocolitica TaxID=630 RepID=UPI0037D87345